MKVLVVQHLLWVRVLFAFVVFRLFVLAVYMLLFAGLVIRLSALFCLSLGFVHRVSFAEQAQHDHSKIENTPS